MSWPAPTGEPVGPGRGPDTPSYPATTPMPAASPHPAAPQPADARYPADAVTQPVPVVSANPTGGSPAGFPSQPVTEPAEVDGGAAANLRHDQTLPLPVTGPSGSHGDIQTLGPEASASKKLAPMSARTGQPVRPWTIWASAVLSFGGSIAVTVGLLLVMWQMASPWERAGDEEWTKVDKFNEATWLTAQFPSEPASWQRVMFAIVCCLIAVLVAGAASVVGYYAFAGYRWTRIGAPVALGVSLLSLLLTPIAAISIGLVALGAAPLWLPASSRFFARWHLLRHPQIAYSEPIDHVFYGPLPRYR